MLLDNKSSTHITTASFQASKTWNSTTWSTSTSKAVLVLPWEATSPTSTVGTFLRANSWTSATKKFKKELPQGQSRRPSWAPIKIWIVLNQRPLPSIPEVAKTSLELESSASIIYRLLQLSPAKTISRHSCLSSWTKTEAWAWRAAAPCAHLQNTRILTKTKSTSSHRSAIGQNPRIVKLRDSEIKN